MQKSLWESKTRLSPFPSMEQDITTDVLIVGGGMAGILCAHKMKEAGIDYTLIESDRICGRTTGNTTAKITSQHGLIYSRLLKDYGEEMARNYWKSNEDAIREYSRMAQHIDCDFEYKNNYIFSTENKEQLFREMAALRTLQIPMEYTKELLLPISGAEGIRFRNQAQFDPLKFVTEISCGLKIFEHTRAMEFQKNSVITNRGKICAKRILIATHFPILNKHGGYFLKMYQQRSYVLAVEKAQQVEGMYLDAADSGISLRNSGNLLLIGGGGHRTGKKGGEWKVLEEFVQKYYPQAREKYRWATQDCMTLDGIPYIGRYSHGTRELYVATGFNKWGMTSAMAAAMLLSDMIQSKKNPYEEVFDPSRKMKYSQLFENMVESTVNLLTPTVPRCPHLGCALKWNTQEHSWDCPCHGSRFEENGKLLEGPANGNLSKPPKE